MKKKIAILLLISVSSIFSCTPSKTTSLSGNWYYINDIDSSYNELYFSEELFVYNLDQTGNGGLFQYLIRKDSIFYTYCCQNKYDSNLDFLFKIKSVSEESFELVEKDGHHLYLQKLKIDKSFLSYLSISDRATYILDSLRINRGKKHLSEHGLAKIKSNIVTKTDSIVFITPEN